MFYSLKNVYSLLDVHTAVRSNDCVQFIFGV